MDTLGNIFGTFDRGGKPISEIVRNKRWRYNTSKLGWETKYKKDGLKITDMRTKEKTYEPLFVSDLQIYNSVTK